MKLPINWLKEYVDTKLSAEKIADKLTMAGLEVDEVVSGHSYSGVVVGHVLSVEKHPNADKLHVAMVRISPSPVIPGRKPGISSGPSEGDPRMRKDDDGEGKNEGVLQIVCGATNLAVGQKVAVAIIGAKLGDYEISKVSLRGVDSFGMICSERELGISDEHSGIMVLDKAEKIGEIYVSDKSSDTVLDISVLANRPDCMSIIGLAREVAVTTGSKLTIPVISTEPKSERRDPSGNTTKGFLQQGRNDNVRKDDISVKVENSSLCPRYMGRFVRNVQSSETPNWMKERLGACGIRPISLFVDISNYVMLEYGQPLHFFDLDKLTDKTIVVRSAKTGEEITTLDGMKRKLTKDNLVIANSIEPIAIAGVMGGATTEIDGKTRNIFIEAAIFDKANIRRTSRALGLRSEAVGRFEKGISQSLPALAIDRAAELLADLGKGEVSKTLVDIKTTTQKVIPIIFDISKMNAFLGTKLAEQEATNVLTKLGFTLLKSGSVYNVTAPSWRIDIAEAVDLYEEVIRVIGYDKVPCTLPHRVESVPEINRLYKSAGMIRDRLTTIGFDEILTYSFIGSKELEAVGVSISVAPEVQNPLVSDQQYLRPTLVPKMLEAIRENQFNKDVLRFFEIGRSFEKTLSGELPTETNWLSLGMTTDYYDAKGAIFNLLATFGTNEDEIVVKPTTAEFLKKGMAADLFVQGKRLVSLGEIREEVRDKFDIKRAVTVATLNIDTLLALDLPETKFTAFSKFQHVTRDISAIFTDKVTVAEIKQGLSRVNKLIQSAQVVDIYQGKNLAPNERSVTIRFIIQSDDRTLTDTEVEGMMTQIYNKIIELGGELRSGSKK